MKRCTLFLSTAGGSGPYGTFTNITTDQTSGVGRQIWHTYLNEQRGGSGPRAVGEQAASRPKQPLLSKDTLRIYHAFHFCQGKKLICPRSTKSERKVFSFFAQEINVPDKWGFRLLGLWSTNQPQITLESRGRRGRSSKPPRESRLGAGKPREIALTCKNHMVNKIKLDIMF